MDEIFLICVTDDGYHGGGFIGFATTKEEADDKVKELQVDPEKCDTCGYVHSYYVTRVAKIWFT